MFGLFKQQRTPCDFNKQNIEVSSEWENKLQTEEPEFHRVFNFEDQSKVYGFLFEVIQVHSDLFFISAICNKSTGSVSVSVKSKTNSCLSKRNYLTVCQDIENLFKQAIDNEKQH